MLSSVSQINFDWLIPKTAIFSLIVSLHDFYRILCIFFAHRPVASYLRLQWNVYNRDGAMALSHCVQVLSPLHGNISHWRADSVVIRGNNQEKVRLCVDIHHPFSKDISLIHLCSLRASLSVIIKMPQWNTDTRWAHFVSEALSLTA